jgi:MoaA/NifB/PqqE/SkfB family radical SAM enzyme
MSVAMFCELIADLKNIGVKSITFTGGGEPLANKEFHRMVNFATLSGFELGLITNAVMLDQIIPLTPIFKFIRVSLNAPSPSVYKSIHGLDQFDKVIKNVKAAMLEGAFVGLSYVVCEENADGIQAASKLADFLGVEYIQFKPAWSDDGTTFTDYRVPDNGRNITTNRFMAKNSDPCKAASLVGVVGAEGNVYYCCQQRGLDKYIVGNINKAKFSEIWPNRDKVIPDFRKCPRCRYMNYVESYSKIVNSGSILYKHRRFL